MDNNIEDREAMADRMPNMVSNAILFNRKSHGKKIAKSPISAEGDSVIDYKNIGLLSKFISEKGRILPSRITMVPRGTQRELKKAIKIARNLALLPFVAK